MQHLCQGQAHPYQEAIYLYRRASPSERDYRIHLEVEVCAPLPSATTLRVGAPPQQTISEVHVRARVSVERDALHTESASKAQHPATRYVGRAWRRERLLWRYHGLGQHGDAGNSNTRYCNIGLLKWGV